MRSSSRTLGDFYGRRGCVHHQRAVSCAASGFRGCFARGSGKKPWQKQLSVGFSCRFSCQQICKMDGCFVSLIRHLHFLEPCLRPGVWIRDAKLANLVVKQQIFMPRLTHSAANFVLSIRATMLMQLSAFLEAVLTQFIENVHLKRRICL